MERPSLNDYLYSLNHEWSTLSYLPVLSVKEIDAIDDNNIRMCFYLLYDYLEFYNYKKNKLINTHYNIYKDNLLLLASYFGKIKIIKYLLKRGFDINYKNVYAKNAYLHACIGGKLETVKYLEKKNINIYQLSSYKKENAYQCASNRPQIIEYLAYQCASNRPKIIEYLESKVLYLGHQKICSICYEIKDDKFITCKNNHIVHLKCQQLINRNRCLMCSARYLI
jgi:hypothetical protein